MIEETLTASEESLEELRRTVPGVATARVISRKDPLMLGRVQVQLQSVDAVDPQPWARVAVPMAGLSHGHYFIPQVGDEVLVAFEAGSPEVPYVVGSLWTAMARPPMSSPMGEVRVIRTLSGNQIAITEQPPAVTIQSAPTPPESIPSQVTPAGPHSSLEVSSQGIKATSPLTVDIQVGPAGTKITITPESVVLQMGASQVALSPSGVEISGPQVSIRADGMVSIRGSQVFIN